MDGFAQVVAGQGTQGKTQGLFFGKPKHRHGFGPVRPHGIARPQRTDHVSKPSGHFTCQQHLEMK